MKKYILTALIAVMSLSVLAMPLTVGAQADDYGLDDDFAIGSGMGTNDLESVISGIINALMGVLGIIAVILILYGGFLWMTAAGNPDKVDKAKQLIFAGIIGLIIILSAYAIARFVLNALSTATNA